MTSGSSIRAMMRTSPPHFSHFSISMANTRLSRCDHQTNQDSDCSTKRRTKQEISERDQTIHSEIIIRMTSGSSSWEWMFWSQPIIHGNNRAIKLVCKDPGSLLNRIA